MRVGLDARTLNVRHLRGMGVYLSGVVAQLDERRGVRWSIFSNRPDLPLHLPKDVTAAPVYLRDVPGYRFHLWEQFVLPAQARYVKVDVLHCPQNSLPLWQPVPTVVTVHDRIEWDERAGWYLDRLLPRAIARCAAVITPSRHSAGQILQHWPAISKKLHVIPHGIGPQFLEISPSPLEPDLVALGVSQPYLLYCGGLLPRKRLNWAIELFAAIEEATLRLVVCGVPAERHSECRATLAPQLRERVRFMPYVPTQALARLYQNAVAVVYPTLYEGFGFPVLEARAVGTPVLFSPHSSLAELAGPGAVMLETEDRLAWIAALRRLLADYRSGRPPDRAAREWARQFSWEASAHAHLAVYRAAAKMRRVK